MIWFTADCHFGHTNIIKFCNRPFITVEQMNRQIIENFQEVVKEGDLTFFIGDTSFNLVDKYLDQIPGDKVLIRGNHDHRSYKKWDFASPYCMIKDVHLLKHNGNKFFLSHYSHRVWPESHFGSFHLYGHSHGTLPGFGRSMDVGVDTNNFYPYSVDEVTRILSAKRFEKVDHHRKAFQ